MTRLVRARHENRLERTLQQLVYPRLLILDELGYLPLPGGSELVLSAAGAALRTGESDRHQQQELRRLGRHLQRPGAGHGDSRPPAPSRDDADVHESTPS